jgi:ribosome-interacting GTPase 1
VSHNNCSVLDAIFLIARSLNYLIDRMWDDLGLVKVYTKKRGAHPDLADPICMRKGSTIEVLVETPASHECSHII